jgi:hypothetical protein
METCPIIQLNPIIVPVLRNKGGILMSVWRDSQRVCGSCKYWTGEREYCYSGNIYKTLEGHGRCCNTNSKSKGCVRNENEYCNLWESSDKK